MKIRTHGPEICAGQPCALHNAQHHMKEWPVSIRPDRQFLVERKCRHGIGHPDPHSVDYLAKADPYLWGEKSARSVYETHGCDGCCRKDDEETSE